MLLLGLNTHQILRNVQPWFGDFLEILGNQNTRGFTNLNEPVESAHLERDIFEKEKCVLSKPPRASVFVDSPLLDNNTAIE